MEWLAVLAGHTPSIKRSGKRCESDFLQGQCSRAVNQRAVFAIKQREDLPTALMPSSITCGL